MEEQPCGSTEAEAYAEVEEEAEGAGHLVVLGLWRIYCE